MLDPKDFMAFLEGIREQPVQPDMIDFYWWSDDELLNFVFDSERFASLDEQTAYDLVWQLAKRYQEALDANESQ